jgi:hypothetical protein
MNKILTTGLLVASLLSLSACMTGMGSAIGQGVASNAIKGSLYKNSARGMTCEEIEADIASRKRGMINPLAIPDIRVQIASVQEVAREKGCPGYTDTSDNNVETIEPLANTN